MRLILIFLLSLPTYGLTCKNSANASLASSTNWDCGRAPLSSDSVVVATGYTVLVTASATTAGVFIQAAATLKFQSATPAVLTGPINSDTTVPPISGTIGYITSDITGGNVPGNLVTQSVNLSYIKISNVGGYSGTQTYGIAYTGTTGRTMTIAHVIFDGVCGAKVSGFNTTDGWYWSTFSFKNTPTNCDAFTDAVGFVTPGAGVVKQMTNGVFDAHTTIGSRDSHFTNIQFWTYFSNSIFTDWAHPFIIDGYSIVRPSWQTTGTCAIPALTPGNLTNIGVTGLSLPSPSHLMMLGDSTTCILGAAPTAATPTATGTITAVGSNTITANNTTGWGGILTDENNVVSAIAIQTATGWQVGRITAANSGTAIITVAYAWDTTPLAPGDSLPAIGNTFTIYRTAGNPHYTGGGQLPSGSTATLYGVLAQLVGGVADNGDMWHSMTCASGNGGALNSGVYVIDRNIIMPSISRSNSGTFITAPNCYHRFTRSTNFSGEQSLAFNESTTNATGWLLELRGNITWAGARSYNPSHSKIGNWVLYDEGIPTLANETLDPIAANCGGGTDSCGDYNADFNQITTSPFGKAFTDDAASNPAYNIHISSGTPVGVHDKRSTNPQFLDPWRTIQSWAYTTGLTSTKDPFAALPLIYAQLMSIYDFGTPVQTWTPQTLWEYYAAGITPHNQTLRGANYDGTDIGALPIVAPTFCMLPNSILCQ